MTPHETEAVDDAMWCLCHGNSEGALSILRELHQGRLRECAAPDRDAPWGPPHP